MTSQAVLMGAFQNLYTWKKPVKLFNTYRGLSFSHDAYILGVEEGRLITNVFGYQAVSMALEGTTHLYAGNLPEPLRANVMEVDFKKKRAILCDFSTADEAIGKRTWVRVQPGSNLPAAIYDQHQHIGCRIVDLSADGLCLFSFFDQLYGQRFRRNHEVLVDLKVPNMAKTLRTRGVITHMGEEHGSNIHRMGLHIFPGPELKPSLEDYITRRQAELMIEIEQAYLSMHNKKVSAGAGHGA